MAQPTIEGLADLTEIGRGGFGVVYRATETDLGRTVAVKVLPPLLEEGAQRRFERERLALGAMSGHPHIVTIHRSGRTDDEQPFLVMEFCERGSIGDELTTAGRLAWERATDIVVKLAGALETAHRAGIVHRDIKPANVLVSNLNEPKLADFGIARMDGAPETQSSSITASLAHAAPEVLDGRRPDARSDVYSLASTLYELLIGIPAFVRPGDDSMLPILNRIAREEVPPIPVQLAPPAVADVIVRAMAKRPEDRPQSAGELGRQLAEAQQRSGVAPTAMMVEGGDPNGGPAGQGPEPSAEDRTVAVDGPFEPPSRASWAPPVAADRRADPLQDGTRDDSRADTIVAAPARSSRVPLLAVIGVAVLVAGGAVVAIAALANGDSATGDGVTTTTELVDEVAAPATTAVVVPPPDTVSEASADPLVVGSLFPQSGDLGTFGPPLLAATELAVEDINAAGGVLGREVVLVPGDSRDRDPEQVRAEVTRFVDESVGLIVGPLTSSDSQVLIEDQSADGLVVISPSATSQVLTDLDTDGTYFRTGPSEVTMGHVTAQILIERGLDRLALVHIDDPYGIGLSEDIRLRYAQLGGVVVVNTAYDPSGDIGPVVDELAAAGAESIVVIGFNETVDILAALQARGVGPRADGTPVFGVDANALLNGDPAVIDGYQSIINKVDLRPLEPFTTRLAAVGIDQFEFTPEAYDAVVIGALAAEVSGATSGPELAAAIVGVTRDGEKCFDFAECKRLIGEGADIDFDGLAGPYELTDAGDPRVASYVVTTYDGGDSPNAALDEYVFSR